jgi:hypothetical protein
MRKTKSGSSSASEGSTGRKRAVAGVVVASVLFVVFCVTRQPTYSYSVTIPGKITSAEYVDETVKISAGTANNVGFLYCTENEKAPHDIVLLHGAAFTKDTWKQAGILQNLCRDVTVRSVTALDFHVNGSGELLGETLKSLSKTMNDDGKPLFSLPVATLVTPSAGGNPVIDWVAHGQTISHILKNTKSWVPVASNGVRNNPRLNNISWNAVRDSQLPILAVYGDHDHPGRTSSLYLLNHAGATLLELPGEHPCYLDSPDAFVDAVIKFVNELSCLDDSCRVSSILKTMQP